MSEDREFLEAMARRTGMSHAEIAECMRQQRERDASQFLERISAFAREQDATVVAVHPKDFHNTVDGLNIKVEYGQAPTPRALRYQYFTVMTHRGFVDVVSDPDAPCDTLHKASFSGVLPSEASDPVQAEPKA